MGILPFQVAHQAAIDKTKSNFCHMKKLILRPHLNILLALLCYWALVFPGISGDEKTTSRDLTSKLDSFHRLTEKERSAIIDEDSKKLNGLYEALLKKLRFGNDEDKFYASFILG
jgi:hypothetical protein